VTKEGDQSASATPAQDSGVDADARKKRRRRNFAIAAALGGFILLIYLVTLVRLGGNIASRSF